MTIRKDRQIYHAVVKFVLIFIVFFVVAFKVDAAIFEKDEITIASDMDATVTNEEGETITVKKNRGLSGNMEILTEKWTLTKPIDYNLTVRSSNSYTYEKRGNGNSTVALMHKDGKGLVMITFEGVGTAKIIFEPEGRIEVKGPLQKYRIHVDLNDNGIYEFEGTLRNKITVDEKGDHIVVNGISGKTKVSIESPDFKKYSEGTYYVFGGKAKLGYTSKGTYIANAVRIPDKSVKKLALLYLRPVNDGKNMFLTWQKVKKAKSYVVYRYDYAQKRYKKVATRDGRGANYYITDAGRRGVYRYKVLAKTGNHGRGKNIGKLSYAVSSVTASDSKGNVLNTSIRWGKKTIRMKSGKKKKLRAYVTGGDKILFDKTLRWYSSNSKVAKIGKKTGIIEAKEKGRCYVWAKAHNGKNSRRIKVIVR